MAPRTPGDQDRSPSRISNTAAGSVRPHPGPTAPAGTHTSRSGKSAPPRAPGTDARRSEQPYRPRWARLASSTRVRLSSVSRPPSLAAACSSPRTSGSRACRGSPAGSPRTPGSTPRRPLRPPCWPSPSATLPRPAAWKSQTACRQASARSPAHPASPRLTAQASQDDPPPSLQPHYRAFIATTGRSAPVPRIGTQPLADQPLGVLPSTHDRGPHSATGRPRARDDRFPRSAPEPGPSSRHLHAGHRLANQQAPARLIPGRHTRPGFDVADSVSTRHQWIAFARLLGPHLTRSRRAFSATLTTTALDRSSLRWFAASPCRAARRTTSPKAGPSISDAAPHQSVRSSTSILLLRSWRTYASEFH